MTDWSRELSGESKLVVATWSGGIDSTAVICELLSRGIDVMGVTFEFGSRQKRFRELEARLVLFDRVEGCGSGSFTHSTHDVVTVMQEFQSRYGPMIPNRNKRLLDLLILHYAWPNGSYDIAMGEYVGADTWLVKDHVGAHDADARFLEAYLLSEYGIAYRMWTLRDFGLPQRYKVDRVRILAKHLDPSLTTNCLHDEMTHCGDCYKCVERAVAFDLAGVDDKTEYKLDPREHGTYGDYKIQQQGGGPDDIPFSSFNRDAP